VNLEFVAEAMLSGIVLCFVLFALSVSCQRARWRRSKRRGQRARFYPTTMMIGLALQNLQLFVQPEVQHSIEEKYADEVEEDDQGDPGRSPEGVGTAASAHPEWRTCGLPAGADRSRIDAPRR
jgi:hypothetical protein